MTIFSKPHAHLFPILLALTVAVAAPAALRAQDSPHPAPAASSTSGPLYEELARLDSALFHAGFVECDGRKTSTFFVDDVEFYHDQTGFEAGEQVRESFRRLAENCPRRQGVSREVVDGTLSVYPMENYGAVQMGMHRFVQPDGSATIARFVHLWQRTESGWLISRVLSFDHRPEPAAALPGSSE